MVLYVQFPLITLEARVGSGTYIRTLGRDIGSRLGGLGVITELRRTSIAPIDGISPTPLEEIDL